MKSINYKYLNILLILGIAYLLFLMKDIWFGALVKILNILLPFIIAFLLAYILYPFMKFLMKKGLPKWLSIIIILITISLIIGLTIYFTLPIFVDQLINLLSNLTKFTSDLASNYNIDTDILNKYLNQISSKLFDYVGALLGDGTIIKLLSTSISFLTNLIIIIIVSVYFLSDMPKLRQKIKEYLLRKSKKKYELIKTINNEIYSYLKGLGIFMIIQFFEYTILFLLIGHPNFLLIGILACVTTVIPYFGGIFTNVLALLIASVISRKLFILTLIITIVFPNIDGYIISPKIYGKTNQMPALLSIFAVAAGGTLFGFTGIVIAVPLTIVLIAIIRAYKGEIENKISKIKRKKKKN